VVVVVVVAVAVVVVLLLPSLSGYGGPDLLEISYTDTRYRTAGANAQSACAEGAPRVNTQSECWTRR